MTPSEAHTIFQTTAAELEREPASIFAARVAITFARQHGAELGLSSDMADVLLDLCLCGETEHCAYGLMEVASCLVRHVHRIREQAAIETSRGHACTFASTDWGVT